VNKGDRIVGSISGCPSPMSRGGDSTSIQRVDRIGRLLHDRRLTKWSVGGTGSGAAKSLLCRRNATIERTDGHINWDHSPRYAWSTTPFTVRFGVDCNSTRPYGRPVANHRAILEPRERRILCLRPSPKYCSGFPSSLRRARTPSAVTWYSSWIGHYLRNFLITRKGCGRGSA
jgi:hypothetical protein